MTPRRLVPAYFLGVLASTALLLLGVDAMAQATADPSASPSDVPPLPSASRSMSLPEALTYARAHQPAIHGALARIDQRIAEARVPSAQWQPVLGATAQLYGMTANNTTATYLPTPWVDVPRIGGTPSTTQATANLAPYASTFVGAGVSQELFDFGRIGAQRAAGDALVDAERRSAEVVTLDVQFGVEEAYFAVLAAKGIVRAADDAYVRSRVHRDLAKRGVDSGMRSPIELTRAEAELSKFDVERVRARGGLAIAEAVLGAAVGAPDETVDTASEAPASGDVPTIAQAAAMARARDPAMAAAIARLTAAEKATRAIGAELRPNLTLTAGLSARAGGASGSGAATPSGNGWGPDVPNCDVGVVLSWPLLDGVISAREDASQAGEQVHRDAIDETLQREVAEVQRSYKEVEVARDALKALQNGVLAARANYDQADARFKAGMGNAVELADAEGVRASAEIQLAIGQFELARSRAAFGRAIAEGL